MAEQEWGPEMNEENDALAPNIREALADDLRDAENAEPAWAQFGAEMWARVDEVSEDAIGADPGWETIVAALRQDQSAARGEFESRHHEFEDGFALRWAEQSDRGFATVGGLMRDEVHDAVADKDGVWSAFAHQVMRAIERSEEGAAEASDQAIAAFRAEVESELDALAPRFDRDFRESVERRIFRAARAPQPWWKSWSEAWTEWLTPSSGLGLAAAMVLAIVVIPNLASDAQADNGTVSVKRLQVDGSVMVMADDGIAVVWVTDNAS